MSESIRFEDIKREQCVHIQGIYIYIHTHTRARAQSHTHTHRGWEWAKLLGEKVDHSIPRLVVCQNHTYMKKKTRKKRISNRSGKNSVIDEDEDELEVV